MIIPGILVCSIFLIIECMYIVSKSLLISSATVIVRHLVEPLCYGVMCVVPSVTVECCVLYPCCVGVFAVKEEGSSPVSLQLLRGGIWVCTRCPCLSLLGTMLADFHMCGIMLVFSTYL